MLTRGSMVVVSDRKEDSCILRKKNIWKRYMNVVQDIEELWHGN